MAMIRVHLVYDVDVEGTTLEDAQRTITFGVPEFGFQGGGSGAKVVGAELMFYDIESVVDQPDEPETADEVAARRAAMESGHHPAGKKRP